LLNAEIVNFIMGSHLVKILFYNNARLLPF